VYNRSDAGMNISTGGPHILLFERDQQLAALLISELQLAGYETHTARTAVEVFDAIARHPVRLVLVNLAQAAAARREFWVALDTQRRGRGVQVLTFHCTNIAGYGPRDPDERPHAAIADVDVDGMLGIMNLIDAVRTRVPGAGSTMSSTMTRVPRAGFSDPPPPSVVSPVMTSGYAPPPSSATNMLSGDTVPRAPAFAENSVNQAPAQPQFAPAGGGQHTFTEKIRAVLYPNQRSWTPQSGSAASSTPESRAAFEQPPNVQSAAVPPPAPVSPSTGATNMLQRLAGGQSEIDGQREPGLAQLSRMLQQNQPAVTEMNNHNVGAMPVSNAQNGKPVRPANQPPGMVNYAPPPVARPPQNSETIGTQPLRASPIQDIPIERPGATGEGSRRPDVLSRANYGQSPLAAAQPPPRTAVPPREPTPQENGQQATASPASGERERDRDLEDQTYQASPQQPPAQEAEADDSAAPNNALLLDIMQSLPPTQSLPPAMQQNQAQALNGRAMRSLGSVLVEGHLVPQNRLEVAQNVQRMLRGVDLNYQLGEILLMFKLLTPDQLLAATLVSEGLITTAQVSALGRIRQELHSIGLEYDLENLLILFRILTPEQLREVRANWQG
jgi:hypothetical protein